MLTSDEQLMVEVAITAQVVDVEARLLNAKNTELRLTDVLKNRTGNVRDVLDVEREIARVRGEIEQLDAQRKTLEHRVSYATVTLTVSEQRKARLESDTLRLGGQLRNAFVDGLVSAYASAVAAMTMILRRGPPLLIWIFVLWWPVRRVYRTFRESAPAKIS